MEPKKHTHEKNNKKIISNHMCCFLFSYSIIDCSFAALFPVCCLKVIRVFLMKLCFFMCLGERKIPRWGLFCLIPSCDDSRSSSIVLFEASRSSDIHEVIRGLAYTV